MAPLRPERSRSSSGNSGGQPHEIEVLQAQQAGRSATHLAAQLSAQSLREASRPAHRQQTPWSSTPTLGKPKSRYTLSQIHKDDQSLQQQHVFSTTQNSIYIPNVPSPLNPKPSWSSSGIGRQEHNAGAREVSHSAGRQDARFLTVPEGGRPATRQPNLRIQTSPLPPLPPMSQVEVNANLPRLTSPRSVRDLGSDYTRYFNPFDPRNGYQQPSAHHKPSELLMSGAAGDNVASDVTRRLSDPFGDEKRLSNPFASPDDSQPPTPDRSSSPINEIHPAVVTLVDAPRTGTPNLIRNADHEKNDFFPYIDDRLCAPDYSFPLITDAKEDDDDMHMPQWDDDIRLKPRLRDHFTRENVVSTFGLFFMLLGLLCIFVVLPVISYTGTDLLDYSYETPLDQMPGHSSPSEPWAHVNDRKYPLLKNIRADLIDPDTPESARTRKSVTGETLVLVFSDEFNQDNRTFYHGDDPYWFAFEGWYGATNDLEWYDPDAVNTDGGTLQFQLDQFRNHDLDFRSGMLNSWNQLCFKGGVFEVSMSLPGPAGKHGLWPGVWTMGNLGRPGYLSTTDGLWPYTYNECDVGITHNQSSTDGISFLPGQRLSTCTCPGEDHPSLGTGRGAPEIDIAEISGDWGGHSLGVATQSFQVAPFDVFYYPNYDFMQTPDYGVSFVNTYTGGPYQQAVSTTTMLNNNWYDGKQYQKFAFEYEPGGDENAFISWTIGDDEMMRFDARAIGPNGNVGQRLVAEEPMSLIMNLGISHSWVDIQFQDLQFPTTLRIDYVRWYQREDEQMVTCDPPGYETTEYIRRHPAAYKNPNATKWEDTGYSWPKNRLVHGCGG